MKYRNIEDTCPLCGSKNLSYADMEIRDESVSYSTLCRSCGATWLQWYSLVYDENTDVMDKDGKEIE